MYLSVSINQESTFLQDPLMRQTLSERGLERACKWTTQDYVKEIFSILDDFEAIRRCWK